MGELDKVQTPDEMVGLILSFSDVNLVSSLFEQYKWTLNEEIKEILYVCRQNQNLAAKLSAIKMLREIVKDTMENSGMIGNVSKKIKGEDGSELVFNAKNISMALNPNRKKVESVQEISNDTKQSEQTKETEQDNGSLGGQGDSRCPSAECGRDNTSGDGGCECGKISGGEIDAEDASEPEYSGRPLADEGQVGDSPCVQHKPPTCRRDIHPGISGSGPAGGN